MAIRAFDPHDRGQLWSDGTTISRDLQGDGTWAERVTLTGTITTGGLTDTQLRATPVPVSGTITVANFPATQPVSIAGTVTVTGTVTTGGLTDTQLRASAVGVTGNTVDNTTPTTSGLVVMGVASFNNHAHQLEVGRANLPDDEGVFTRLETNSLLRLHDFAGTSGQQLVSARGDQTNGLWVNVKAAPTTAVTGTFWQATQPVSLASLPALAAGTAYAGKVRITDGTLDTTLLNSAPVSDTGQVSVPVRVISSLATGGAGGGTSAAPVSVSGSFAATGSPITLDLTSVGGGGGVLAVTAGSWSGFTPLQGSNDAGVTWFNIETWDPQGQFNTTSIQNPTSVQTWRFDATGMHKVKYSATTGSGSLNATITVTPATAYARRSVQVDGIPTVQGTVTVAGSQGQQIKQTPTNFNTQVELAVGGTLIDPRGLTDTQLRASAVPVSLASVPSHAVTGPLTDTQLRASAVPISLATAPTTPVTGTFFQATQPVSLATNTPDVTDRAARLLGVVDKGKVWDGTNIATVKAGVIAVAGDNPLVVTVHPSSAPTTAQAVTGTFFQATQPVSAAALPLPTGAATSALQTTISGQLPTTLSPKSAATSLATAETASALAVTVTAATGVAATATLPAVAAAFHYITAVEIELYATAARTGGATPVLVTTTNLPGSPVWDFDTAQVIGATIRKVLQFSQPLKSSVINTATTFVAPIATTGIWRINVYYYTAA